MSATRKIEGRTVRLHRCEGISPSEALDRLEDRVQYAPEMDLHDLAADIEMEAREQGANIHFRITR